VRAPTAIDAGEKVPFLARVQVDRRREFADLFDEAKAAAPDALLTYINYPPTEYLDTSAFDPLVEAKETEIWKLSMSKYTVGYRRRSQFTVS
jgi:hypothetical protein